MNLTFSVTLKVSDSYAFSKSRIVGRNNKKLVSLNGN